MDIEDVIGDIMLNLFNKADVTARVENLAAYIYRTLYNKAIDGLKSFIYFLFIVFVGYIAGAFHKNSF